MTRSADDFEAIRTRRDELQREHDTAIRGGEPDPLPPEWLTPEAIERKQRDDSLTGEEIAAIVSILGRPALAGPLACAFQCVGHIEMARGPEGWRVSGFGYSVGPYRDLDIAMKAVRVFRQLAAHK